jgi:GTP-binding protein
VVDVEEGITPMDDAVARLLRKVTKPVLLVNKVDNAMREKDIEFYNLGLGEYYTLRVFQEVELEIYWMH